MKEELKLSLVNQILPVTLEGEEGEKKYELREMTAASRDSYLTQMSSRIKIGEDGKPTVKKFDGMQASLLTLCLFKKEDGKAVPEPEIQKWPSSVVSELFKQAQLLNHLSEDKDEEAATKNG